MAFKAFTQSDVTKRTAKAPSKYYMVTYVALDDREKEEKPFLWQQIRVPFDSEETVKSSLMRCVVQPVSDTLFASLPSKYQGSSYHYSMSYSIITDSILSVHGIALPEMFMGKWKANEIICEPWDTLAERIGQYHMNPKLLYLQNSKDGDNQDAFKRHFWSHGDYFHFRVLLSMKKLPEKYQQCLSAILESIISMVDSSNNEDSDTRDRRDTRDENEPQNMESKLQANKGIRHRKTA